MDLSPVITRLRDQCATTFRQYGGAAELDAAIASAPVTPSVWVMPLADRADEPHLAASTVQTVQRHFSVVLCLSNRADVTGSAAAVDLKTLRMAARYALLGWVPYPDDDIADGLVYTGGRLLHFKDSRLWWADEYRVMTTTE